MSFRREKRLLLGLLALLVPAPLPWNESVEWPVLFLYWALVLGFLHRADRDLETRVPSWLLNLLGFAYLPFLVVDLRASFSRGRVVTALVHLILFLIVVKLWALFREREKWQVLVAIFFVFVGAMATSSHVSVVLYLAAFVPLSLYVLARFAYLHVLAAAGRRAAPPALALGRPLGVVLALALVAAVPLFAIVPRYRSPFLFGPGGVEGVARTTGFSDSVDLNLASSVRGNRNVVMRLQYDEGTVAPAEPRIKGAAFDFYRRNRWYRVRQARRLPGGDAGARLAEVPVVAGVEVYLEPLESAVLPLPVETATLAVADARAAQFLEVDPGGAVSALRPTSGTLRYHAGLAAEPVLGGLLDPAVTEALADPAATAPGPAGEPRPILAFADRELAALDPRGISPRMSELAATVMGEGTIEERVDRLERHLLAEYGYTTSFLGREGVDPIDEFLFTYRTGHCELFASAMVLLLRSQGVPARLVTGFLGAEDNPFEGFRVVRAGNAHAWVEAYTPARGWRVYDPTPPEGRPVAEPRSVRLLVTQAYDFLTFRWDRYVLTFGADDQAGVFERLRARVRRWRLALFGGEDEEEATEKPPAVALPDTVFEPAAAAPGGASPLVLAAAGAAIALLAGLALAARRRLPTGGSAYRHLRRRLADAGLELGPATAPLALARSAGRRFPAAAAALAAIVERYLAESFAGRTLADADRRRLAGDLEVVERALREERRRLRRSRGSLRPRAA